MAFVDVRSLRTHPHFRLFFFGQLVSLIGSWMQGVAQQWLVYDMTGSGLSLGAVSFAQNLPVLLLSPAAGWVADRFSRKSTVLVTHVLSMAQATTLAWLTLTGRVTVTHVLLLGVVFGISNAFEMPSRQSLVGDLVGREDLPNAIALNSSMMNVTRIIGPAIAGVVVGALGSGQCFAINAASFIAAIATILVIRVPRRPRPIAPRSPLREIVEGVGYVRAHRPVIALLVMIAVSSFMSMPQIVLLPVFAKSLAANPVFGWDVRGPLALGLLQSSVGAGALIGALSLSRRVGVRGFGRVVVTSGILAGISLILFALSPWLPLSMLLVAPVGFGLMRLMAATNTLLQSMTKDELRGRVLAFYAMMLIGVAPFTALIAGASAEAIGHRWTGVLFGAMGLAFSTYALTVLPSLRGEAREMLIAAGALPGDSPEAKTAEIATPHPTTPPGAHTDLSPRR